VRAHIQQSQGFFLLSALDPCHNVRRKSLISAYRLLLCRKRLTQMRCLARECCHTSNRPLFICLCAEDFAQQLQKILHSTAIPQWLTFRGSPEVILADRLIVCTRCFNVTLFDISIQDAQKLCFAGKMISHSNASTAVSEIQLPPHSRHRTESIEATHYGELWLATDYCLYAENNSHCI
jgi:hypothetical protein